MGKNKNKRGSALPYILYKRIVYLPKLQNCVNNENYTVLQSGYENLSENTIMTIMKSILCYNLDVKIYLKFHFM